MITLALLLLRTIKMMLSMLQVWQFVDELHDLLGRHVENQRLSLAAFFEHDVVSMHQLRFANQACTECSEFRSVGSEAWPYPMPQLHLLLLFHSQHIDYADSVWPKLG